MDTKISHQILSSDNIDEVAALLLDLDPSCRIFLLDASMGAGKTTLIKTMCRALGSQDSFSSPSFSLVNEYAFPGGKIYHMDLYRLRNEKELLDLGPENYLDSGEYVFVEWPQLIEPLVRGDYMKIRIEMHGYERFVHAEKKKA